MGGRAWVHMPSQIPIAPGAPIKIIYHLCEKMDKGKFVPPQNASPSVPSSDF